MPPETIATADTLLDRLARFGERLPADVRADILQRGSAVVPELIRIVEDEDLGFEGSLGDGWTPIHAVDLLLDLKAEAAVPALLSALVRSHWEEILYNKLAVRLPELGSVVFEPAAALMETVTDEDGRSALCSVLAKLGVRDERVLTWCKKNFDRDPVIGAINFGDYRCRRGR